MGMGSMLHVLVAVLVCSSAEGFDMNRDLVAITGTATSDFASTANPIRRVVNLLQKMAKKVAEEAEKEEELYSKFRCYCKTSGGDLALSVAEAETKVPQLVSDIEEAENALKALKLELPAHQDDRSAAKSAMQTATSQRDDEHKKFLQVESTYKDYLEALGSAIPALEKGMAGGFLQTATGAKLRQAIFQDPAITEYDRSLVSSFLSVGSGDEAHYIPKSGEIVGILKSIMEDYEKSLKDVTAEEHKSVSLYEELMAAKKKQVEVLTNTIETKTARIGELGVKIASMKNDMSETEAALAEDRKFAASLETECSSKAAEWEERKKLRAEELVALHETIKILNDDDALDLFKKALPSPSLLQLDANKRDMIRKTRALLRPDSDYPQLDFIALALSGKSVDFTKVIKMIDDMLHVLDQERVDDENKKEYCEKQIDSTEDKVKVMGKRIEDLQASIEQAKDTMSTLTGEIKSLTKGIAALDKSVADATELRKEQHGEYQELMSSNRAAKDLLAFARNRLHKFYNPALYKPPPNRTLTEEERIYSNMGGELEPTPAPGGIADTGISALQGEVAMVQVAEHRQRSGQILRRDAPPAAPETWDAYSKKNQESSGVINMIDLLIRDLDKEMTEAETEEKSEQKQYEKLMQEAAAKRAEDLKLVVVKENAKADAEVGKAADEESEESQSKEFTATHMYLMNLHAECDWLLQHYDLRKQGRAQEADSLKQAKAVLSGADFSLVQGIARGNSRRSLRGVH